MRGKTNALIRIPAEERISIHSPHAREDCASRPRCSTRLISIHSPHAREDVFLRYKLGYTLISIHSPHAREDLRREQSPYNSTAFQSTPLMRGKTSASPPDTRRRAISIHSPHAREDMRPVEVICDTALISIHSPHAREDLAGSRRRRTRPISIHSPHAREDRKR